MGPIELTAASPAEDIGLLALRDLARLAQGLDYRVIGGHMVHILMLMYPCERSIVRGTADADAGIRPVTASSMELHNRLIEAGYKPTSGNSYQFDLGGRMLQVDLLVPGSQGGQPEIHGGRTFDVAPGLMLALSQEPHSVDVTATLTDDQRLEFTILVPTVEAAVIMKTLVRDMRLVPKDVTDLANLLEAALEHRNGPGFVWRLDRPDGVRGGSRRDAARMLHDMANRVDLGYPVVRDSGVSGPRFSALIRSLIARA